MRHRTIGLFLLFTCTAPALAGAQGSDRTLDLEAVVRLALDANPGFLAEKERLREVEAGVTEVRADAYPQLSFNTGWDLSRNPSLLNSADFEEFVEMFPGGSFEPRRQELFTISTEVRQPLFTWGKVGAALDLAKSVVEVTEAQISAVRLDTAAEAGRAFYELLSRKQALGALQAQEEARREALEVVQARYDLQDATRLDLLRAQASLAQVSPSVEEARGQISVAESRLRRALGEKNSDLALRLPPVSRDAVTSPLPEPPPLDTLQEEARRRRPELADLAAQGVALDHQGRVIRADGKPRLDFTGAYGRAARLPENLSDPLFRDWRLALEVSWQFFDGGRRRGQVEQLESQQRQLDWQRRDRELQIAEEVAAAHAAVTATTARWRAAEGAAEAAAEARRVAAEGYREGVALQLDLLDAQEQETAAELELIRAYYDALGSWVDLHRAVGRLPSSPVAHPVPEIPEAGMDPTAPERAPEKMEPEPMQPEPMQEEAL